MEGIDLDKVTQEENTSLERPISKAEIADFIKSMSNDKAPIDIFIPESYTRRSDLAQIQIFSSSMFFMALGLTKMSPEY